MNICIRCNKAETTGALCPPCRREVRAAIAAEVAPIHAAREAQLTSRRAQARRLMQYAINNGA